MDSAERVLVTENHGERLATALRELQAALEEAESLDPELEAPLRAVLGEIDGALARTSEAGQSERPVSRVVEVLALDFEVAHPVIAGLLNRLTHLLAGMGI